MAAGEAGGAVMDYVTPEQITQAREMDLLTYLRSYVGELTFNLLILVGSVRMSDHVVREMMGL